MKKTTLICDMCGNEIKEGAFTSESYGTLVGGISVCVNVYFDEDDICQPCAISIFEEVFIGKMLKHIKKLASDSCKANVS
jgi:hypothetical protein